MHNLMRRLLYDETRLIPASSSSSPQECGLYRVCRLQYQIVPDGTLPNTNPTTTTTPSQLNNYTNN